MALINLLNAGWPKTLFVFKKAVSAQCSTTRCACAVWEGHWAVDAPRHSCWGLAALWGGDPIPTA